MNPLVLIGLGIVGLYLLYRWRKKEAPVQLTEGWNEVHYTGPEQRMDKALASIVGYFSTVYHYNPETEEYTLIQGNMTMVPCQVYWIHMVEDRLLTY